MGARAVGKLLQGWGESRTFAYEIKSHEGVGMMAGTMEALLRNSRPSAFKGMRWKKVNSGSGLLAEVGSQAWDNVRLTNVPNHRQPVKEETTQANLFTSTQGKLIDVDAVIVVAKTVGR